MSNFFQNEDNLLINYAQTNGKKLYGETKVLQVTAKPTNQAVAGQTITWDIDANGDQFLDDARIVTVLSALTAGTGGSYQYFIDAVGIYLWDKFDLKQHGEIKRTVYVDNLYNSLKYDLDTDKYARISQDLGIASSTNRATLGASQQTFAISLKRIFNLFTKPLDRSLYKNAFQIVGYLKSDFGKCIQTDKTGVSFTMVDCYLDMSYIKANRKILQATRESYIKNSNMGAPQYDIEYLTLPFSVLAGATTTVVTLAELQGKNVIDIRPILRATSLKNTLNGCDFTDTFIAPTSWNLKSNSNYISDGIQQDITKTYYDRVIFPRKHFVGEKNLISSLATTNEFVISFAHDYIQDQDEGRMYHGSRFFTENDAKLTINFASLAANTDLDVLVRCAKRVQLVNGVIMDL
jgi:hypothetical protein